MPETPWDDWNKKTLIRKNTLNGEDIALEPGVNFFVYALERAGAKVLFSCEGHPTGFYIAFEANYELAFDVTKSGFVTMQVMPQRNRWKLSIQGNERGIACEHGKFTVEDRNRILRSASLSWANTPWFVLATGNSDPSQ